METSKTKVAFLDTTVILRDKRIATDLYNKRTDSHNYLRYTFAHPRKCKESIPYSQFLRIRRICSNLNDFDKHVIEYSTFFPQRGSP